MAHTPKDIELGDEERRLLADAAKQTGKPWRLLLREAIARFIKTETKPTQNDAATYQETLLDKLQRLGAVGMIRGGPADLSTNKNHMEGFGQDQ